MNVIEKRIAETSYNNRNWYFEYLENLKKEGESKGSINQYRSLLTRIFEANSHEDINTVNYSIVRDFISKFDNSRTKTSRSNWIKKFFLYLKEERNVTVYFDIELLNEFNVSRKQLESEETRIGEPLSIEELIKLRGILKRNEDFEQWLTFELIYQYGFTIPTWNTITIKSYNLGTKTLTVKGESYKVSGLIDYLLSKPKVLPDKKFSSTTFNYRIKEIGDLIGKSIIWKDIIATRHQNFYCCPNCKKMVENNSENWVVFHYTIDNSKWLVCKKCGEKLG